MNKPFTSEVLRQILDELSPEILYKIDCQTKGSFLQESNGSFICVEWNNELLYLCLGRNISPGFSDPSSYGIFNNWIKDKIKIKHGFINDKEYEDAWWGLKTTLLEEERHKRESDSIISESESIINKS